MEAFFAYQGIHDYYLDSESGTYKKCTSNEQKEEERQRWITALKSILPAAFRIGTAVHEGLRERLEKELDDHFGKEVEIIVQPKGGDRLIKELNLKPEAKMIAPARKIPYIPHAYQLSVDRKTLRSNPGLEPFHEWLKIQTEAGFITRQETVSMIPPIVLDPKPENLVLDMCAAPGSKTSQLLEVVNMPAHLNDHEPSGCVVANDSDTKRAYMLVHQLRRINSPAFFITTCDAQFFPLLRDENHPTEGIFDRVLCDVPCSGDGTSRKNPGIWKKWNNLNAYGLHTLQLGIALKGARLTKVGGYMCYSTCSMNPMENESVVAELLRASEGSLELVERRGELPGLFARPGMETWKVLCEDKSKKQMKNILKKKNAKMQARKKEWEEKNDAEEIAASSQGVATDSQGDENKEEKMTDETTENQNNDVEETLGVNPIITPFVPSSMDEEELKKMVALAGLKEYSSPEEVPCNLKKRIRVSCFPPTPEEASKFHLERCMRVLPHDMDTGGFFVALLKKVAPLNARAKERFENIEEELVQDKDEEDDEQNDEPKVKKVKIDPEDLAGASMEDDTDVKENTESEIEKVTGDDSDVKDLDGSEGAGYMATGEKDSSAVVRGHVKKNFLPGKDGKKHESLGKDDFVPVPDNLFEPLKEFYGLSSDSFDETSYMIRAGSDAKVLYFICKTAHSLIDRGLQERITVVHSGLQGFKRCNKECKVRYRVAQEAVHFVAPHMTKRKIGANVEDFKKCLQTGNIPIKEFSAEFAEKLSSLTMGSFVVYLNGYEDDYIKKLLVVMWRCRGDAISALVTKEELDGMHSKLRSILHEDEPMDEPEVAAGGNKE